MNNLLWFLLLVLNPISVILALSGCITVDWVIYANLIGSIIFGMHLQDMLNAVNERSS